MSDRIDAVLPLTAGDADRAQILFRSLERYFEPLGTCFVVAPDRDVDVVRRHVPTGRYAVVPESDVVPEIPYFWATARVRAKLRLVGPPIHGWFLQQVVKLAIVDRATTPFYLTLDADVMCVRPTSYDDLVRDGRAVVQTTQPSHPEYNDMAERVLGLPRSRRQHGVTPALLAREGVLALASYLESRVHPRLRRLARALPEGSLPRAILGSWRSDLIRKLPWTEYALYHTFLEGTGRFDTYHVDRGEDAIYANCVWIEAQFDEWRPEQSFESDDGFRFSIVQSATRITPDVVWERVAPYLGASSSSDSAPAAAAAGTTRTVVQ